MSETHDEMQVFAADQGLLVWGPSRALDLLDQAEDVRAKVVTPSLVAKLSTLVQGISQAQLEGARYLRLDDKSYETVKALGVKT